MSYMDHCDWSRCTRCGECLSRCPVLQMDPMQAREAVEKLIQGDPCPEVLDRCSLCFNCNQYCPEGLRPHEMILQRVAESRKKPVTAFFPYLMNGLPGPNFFRDLYTRLEQEENAILDRWAEPPPEAPEILFTGCIGRLSCLDLERSSVLAGLPKYGPRDLCCGELQYRLGSWEAYTDRAEKTVAALSALKTGRLVCYCASCRTFLTVVLEKVYGKKLPFEVISLYEWLWEKVQAGEIETRRPAGGQAVLSESCYASELGPGFTEALHGLAQATGLDMVPAPHHGKENLSCGAVCFSRTQNPLKGWGPTQRAKYRDLKASGRNTAALHCPGCFLTMFPTAPLAGVKLSYLPEVFLQALGDDITRPLKSRMPMVVKTLLSRAPLLLKKADPRTMEILK